MRGEREGVREGLEGERKMEGREGGREGREGRVERERGMGKEEEYHHS